MCSKGPPVVTMYCTMQHKASGIREGLLFKLIIDQSPLIEVPLYLFTLSGIQCICESLNVQP